MSSWQVIYRDVDKVIERRQTGKGPDGAIFEERTTWTNPDTVDARLTALEAKVDTVEATPLSAQERA